MSRARKILEFIIANPRCGFDKIHAALTAAGMTCKPTALSAQLSQLTRSKKVKRTGEAFAYRYTATAQALVDGRRKLGPTKEQKRQAARQERAKRKAAQLAPAPEPPRPSAPPSPPPKPPADSPARISLTATFLPNHRRRAGELTSDEIAADVAEYLRRGGRIEQLDAGASSKPLRHVIDEAAYTAVNERSWRERERRLAKQADTTEDDDGERAAA